MKKAAIYTRLSEEDRNKLKETDDSNSIQNQKTMLIQYADEMGWEVYEIYSDDDYAGADRRRPEFNRLLEDARQRKFDIVLCKTQSRFTRELELVEKYIHGLFPRWGIRFVSIVDNADTDNKGNKKSRQINGLVNEWYLEDMSENIRSVLTSRRQNGFHIGAFALYGYMKDPDQKGHLIIDREAADVVREVFTLFAGGMGKTAIARQLNDRGIPNPSEYKRQKGLRYKQPERKNSTLWKYFTISDMLINEIYIGNMVQGKYGSVSYKTKENKPRPKSDWYVVKGTHEPIIEPELWQRVQNLVKQRAKPFATGNIGLFARKVLCANCGYTMRSSKCKGQYYLQCSNRHISKNACIGAFISQSRLEQMVLNELKSLSAQYLDKDALESQIIFADDMEMQRIKLVEAKEAFLQKTEMLTKALRDLYMDKVKGLIGEADYSEMSIQFTDDRTRCREQLEETDRRLEAIKARISAGDNRRELIDRYTGLSHLNREMMETLVDHIEVGKRIQGTRDVPVEIHWNF